MARLSNGHTIVNVCCAIYRVSGSTTVIRFDSKSSLPPANEVCEGYVFTGLSTAGMGVGSQYRESLSTGSLSRGGGLCPEEGVSVQRRGSLSRGISVQAGSLSGGSLSRGVSVQAASLSEGSLSRGSLPRGLSAQVDPRTVTCGPYAS